MNMKCLLLLTPLLVAASGMAAGQALTYDQQITAAVLPAPEEHREAATVIGFDDRGHHVVVREGSNHLVCLSDDPGDDRFHVACYHRALEPFMQRGRDLRREGRSSEEIQVIREEEAVAGTLAMPDHPAALYSLTAKPDDYDAVSGTLSEASRLYVVYTPYATESETGLSTVPGPGKPWLMDAGKPWAHIMLFPE